ncbi:hypothetical protein ABET51_06755 [Metabacillus fastidiosus]|uniref:hypothetical protein n=1 Tax=Metabacillus fastidiosus TaxID=1458 RepID=UPI003D2C9D19
MKLDKTAYLFKTEEVEVGRDFLGRPIYEAVTVPAYPFNMEYEPYSSERAKADMAINMVEVNYLMYTYPNKRLTLYTSFMYKDKTFKITYPPIEYDNHYEILIQDTSNL